MESTAIANAGKDKKPALNIRRHLLQNQQSDAKVESRLQKNSAGSAQPCLASQALKNLMDIYVSYVINKITRLFGSVIYCPRVFSIVFISYLKKVLTRGMIHPFYKTHAAP